MMKKWRRVWREGLAPRLSRSGLVALETALAIDDPRLVQGLTCLPASLDVWRDRAVESACALCLSGWRGEGLRTVGQVEAYFHRLCDAADATLNEAGACRYFLNWYDDAPRAEMRRELLAEVRLALQVGVPIAA